MWYRNCSRKELLEIVLSPNRERHPNAEYLRSLPDFGKAKDVILLAWERDPLVHAELPCLAVLPEKDLIDTVAALNASPQAPSPFTSFCRLLSREEFAEYQNSDSLDLSSEDVSPFIALSYVEALLHADGQAKFADLSPAVCNRTLSLSWAKAIARRVPFSQLPRLIEAWIDTYVLTGTPEKGSKAKFTIASLTPILTTLTQLQFGGSASGIELELCRAVASRAKEQQEEIWARLRANLSEVPTIAGIAEATREERASFFQTAAQKNAPALVLGFLASQISPGSLDHLELAMRQSNPQIGFWYAAFAALWRPAAIVSGQGGQGARLLRLAGRPFELTNSPQCDISHTELRVLIRAGLDQLARKLEHSGEMIVELVPLVTCAFRFPGRANRSAESVDLDRASRQKIAQERLRDRLLHISRTLEDLALYNEEQLELEQQTGIKQRRASINKSRG